MQDDLCSHIVLAERAHRCVESSGAKPKLQRRRELEVFVET